MPFTFAHPAAALPFLRIRRGSDWTEALVVGTLVPDLLRPISVFGREFTHSIPGWILLDTPVALLVTWLVHHVLTPRIGRLPGLGFLTATPSPFRWATTAVGCALGGLTHLGWDLFTHDQSPFTTGPILSRILFDTPAGPFQLGQTLWFLHTLVGLLAVGIWIGSAIHRSQDGLRSVFCGTWLRLVILPTLPFLAVFHGFQRASGNGLKDVFLHVFYLTGELPHILLVCSTTLFVSLFCWETRAKPIYDRESGPE